MSDNSRAGMAPESADLCPFFFCRSGDLKSPSHRTFCVFIHVFYRMLTYFRNFFIAKP